MLSIGFVSVGKGSYYTSIAREDYWRKGGESPGVWFENDAARSFGLRGQVKSEHIENLFKGYDPDGVRGLGLQNEGKENRRAAVDLTFSVPKTVSAMMAVAPPEVRRRLEEAVDRAVETALAFVNEQAGYSRIGKGGYEREKVDLLFAKYVHRSSRAQESQYHVHCLALNLARLADGRYRSIDGKALLDIKKAAGALFRSALTYEMGIEVERDPNAKFSFRVKGVPQELADLWSSRAKEIQAEIREQGVNGARAKALVALSTRQVKGHRAISELRKEWLKTAAEHGFTPEDAARIFRTRFLDLDPKARDAAIDQAISESIKQLTAKEAHFGRNDLLRDACIATVHQGIDPSRIAARVDETLKQEQFISLGGRDQRFTTQHIYQEIEGRAHSAADELSKRTSRTIKEEDIGRAIDRSPHRLNAGQVAAVELALKGPDLVLMEGPPGAGKSALFKVVRHAIEADHHGKVYGLCPSNRAARELAVSSGMKCYTIDRFIRDQERTLIDTTTHHAKMVGRQAMGSVYNQFHVPVWKPLRMRVNKRTTLVIDECSMCENWKLSKALQLAERTGCRVVMTGDRFQLPAIGQGGLYADLYDRASDAQRLQLTEIVRQDNWTREAIQNLRSGKIHEALKAYEERGCLHRDAKTRAEAGEQLIEAWKKEGIERPKESLIIAQTNAEVHRLNAAAQEARREAGKLGWRHLKVGSGETIHVGDRVLFTENRKDISPLVVKSQFATVTHIDMVRRKVTVEVDGPKPTLGEKVKHHATMLVRTALNEIHRQYRLPITKLSNKVTFSLREFNDMRLSYAVTTHRSQSMTLDRDVFILAGGSMQGFEMGVVQLSRARV